jgi:hypothetical protein
VHKGRRGRHKEEEEVCQNLGPETKKENQNGEKLNEM